MTQPIELFAFISYFILLGFIAFLSYKKQKTEEDYILGARSLNFWLTALSAHASDMGSWLFLGYPALIFVSGMNGAWAAIGLILFMYLNWQFIAPKIRVATEQTKSLTLSAYFESRFGDTKGTIRVISAAISVLFFTVYISSGLVGMGIIVETLFGINYGIGISIGLAAVVAYVLSGGYKTIAWIDLFQGFFLLFVILLIPLIFIGKIGGITPIFAKMKELGLSTKLFSRSSLLKDLFVAAGWGLGYFGQPHIITKFMGIGKVSEMHKAKYLGITWQTLALFSATLIGFIAIYLFTPETQNPETVILDMVKNFLPPFFSGLVLCAILAATTNVMAAQILVSASNLSEDFYKRIINRNASTKRLLWISRMSVLTISFFSFLIAFFKVSTIYELVFYAWSGLGATFGPLLILSLYRKNITKEGALAGIISGALVAAFWKTSSYVPPLVVAFLVSLALIELVSFFTRNKKASQSK